MSMVDNPGPLGANNQGASATDIYSALQGIRQQLAAWVTAFKARAVQGSFTMGASSSTVVPNTAVQGTSFISFTPTNASAATLVGSGKSPYVQSISPGVSFTVATANATAAVGTETFNYTITTAG